MRYYENIWLYRKDPLSPGEATIAQIRPVAGLLGDDDGTTYNDTVTCTDSQGTKWTNAQDTNAGITVYIKPDMRVSVDTLQVGTVLNDYSVTVFPTPYPVSYEVYSKAADGTKTTLSKGPYTVLPGDVGKTIGIAASAMVNGVAGMSVDDIIGTVPPVAASNDGEYWSVTDGYTASDIKPSTASMVFTNYGQDPISNIKVRCILSSPALVCGGDTNITELGSGKSATITVTPQMGQKIGTYSAQVYLSNPDNTISSYAVSIFTVNQVPFDWIQPVESSSTAKGGADQNSTGSASSGGNKTIDTGGTVSHGSVGIALLGLGFIVTGALVLKRRVV